MFVFFQKYMSVVTKLEHLGFSPNESKLLYVLGLKGSAKPTELAKEAAIPYSKIYEVLNRLEERGYIKSTNTKPKLYEIIDVKGIFDRVVEEKEKELSSIREDIKSEEIQSFIDKTTSERQTLGVWIVEGKAARDAELKSDYAKAKKEIDMLGDMTLATTVMRTTLEKKVKEGVRLRVISQDNATNRERGEELRKIGAIVKYVPEGVLATFKGAVIDSNIAHFTLQNPPKRVCTNYSDFATFLKNFFDYWWKQAKD